MDPSLTTISSQLVRRVVEGEQVVQLAPDVRLLVVGREDHGDGGLDGSCPGSFGRHPRPGCDQRRVAGIGVADDAQG